MWNAQTWAVAAFLVANAPVYLLIGRVVFGSWDGFFDDWSESTWPLPKWGTPRTGIFLIWVGATLAAEYCLLDRFLLR